MANTLVIPETDFSNHKIETVSFDPVPPAPTLEIDWQWSAATASSSLATYTMQESGTYAYKYMTAFGKGVSKTEHELASTTSDTVTYPYAIKFPSGTTKVKVSATTKTGFYNGSGARIVWTEDVDSGASGNVHKIKAIQRDNFNTSEVPVEISVPENADSFVLTMRFTDAQSGTANACAESCGISIEFLTT